MRCRATLSLARGDVYLRSAAKHTKQTEATARSVFCISHHHVAYLFVAGLTLETLDGILRLSQGSKERESATRKTSDLATLREKPWTVWQQGW